MPITLRNKPFIYDSILTRNDVTIQIDDIPRVLNKDNIENVLKAYIKLLNTLPLTITANSRYNMLCDLKRKPIKTGPYPDVSLSESSNRILSDLTILFAIRALLKGVFPDVGIKEYLVEFGNESRNTHDIVSIRSDQILYGEAFNVSKSLFNLKKNKSLIKLKKTSTNNEIMLVTYNNDASDSINKPCIIENIHYLPIEINI